jgi:phosphate transport system substrate-binding protein
VTFIRSVTHGTFLSALAFLISIVLTQPLVAGEQSALIRMDGCRTVWPVSEAVSEEFQTCRGSARVTVGVLGPGGGFKKFCRGETDIQGASRPITAQEMEGYRSSAEKRSRAAIHAER